jgi:mannitol-1-/sugar-/sorbitol-6-phosphatase
MLALTWPAPEQARRSIRRTQELAGAHHRVDTLSDTVPLITGWLDRTHK